MALLQLPPRPEPAVLCTAPHPSSAFLGFSAAVSQQCHPLVRATSAGQAGGPGKLLWDSHKLWCNLPFSFFQISSSRRSCLLRETQVSQGSHGTGSGGYTPLRECFGEFTGTCLGHSINLLLSLWQGTGSMLCCCGSECCVCIPPGSAFLFSPALWPPCVPLWDT